MFDLGWSELLVIAVVAIIFIGPRELVPMLRSFGRFAAKMKSMANEFQSQFNDALRDAELDQVKKQVESAGNLKPMNALRKQLEDVPRSVEKAISETRKRAGTTAGTETAKPAARKSSAKKSGTKKPAAKKTAPRKAAAGKKSAAKKPAKSSAAKSSAAKSKSSGPARRSAKGSAS